MAARLPRLTAPLLALAALAAGARGAAAQAEWSAAGWRQLVTRADIERAGIMRLGELVRLARGWDVVTVDEYTWRASPGALAPLEDDAWMVTLDGHRLEPALLGVLALERLPIDLGGIDSVVFVAAPSLAAGTMAGRGVLQIHSARPAPGPQARARFTTGAETGDPGPYAFLPGAVPNRDRLGNDASFGLAYGGRGWHADLSLGLGVHFAADDAIRDRLLASGPFPRIERAAPSLRVAVGDHRFSVGRSGIDDWFRLEALGVEFPVHSTLEHAGLDGRLGAGATRFGYRLGYERSALESLPFVQPALQLATRTIRADLAVEAPNRRAGIGAAHTTVLRPSQVRESRTLELHAFGEQRWRIGAAHDQTMTVTLAAAEDAIGAAALFLHRWRASGRGTASLLLSLDQPLPAGDASLWSLVSRGFPWLGDADVPVRIDSGGPRARQAGADLAWSHRVSASFTVSAAALYRAFRSGYLADRELDFDADRLAWRGPVDVVAGHTGQSAGFALGTEVSAGNRATLRGWYRYRAVLSGGDEVRDAWSALPRHAGAVDAAFAPVPSLELDARLALRGTIDRAEYRAADALELIGARTGAALTAELGVQKWLWRRRLRARVSARNLFDARDVTHPEGGSARRAFVVAAEGRFP
jgi:hypothetical protein